jgi:hypothetical protein
MNGMIEHQVSEHSELAWITEFIDLARNLCEANGLVVEDFLLQVVRLQLDERLTMNPCRDEPKGA